MAARMVVVRMGERHARQDEPAEVVRVVVRDDGRLFLPSSQPHCGGTLFGTTQEFTHAIEASDGDALDIVRRKQGDS